MNPGGFFEVFAFWDKIILISEVTSTSFWSTVIIYFWVNYNNSLIWNKAILGWFLLLTMIPVRSQWGRYNLPRYLGGHCMLFFFNRQTRKTVCFGQTPAALHSFWEPSICNVATAPHQHLWNAHDVGLRRFRRHWLWLSFVAVVDHGLHNKEWLLKLDLVAGAITILKNMKVNGKDYPIYYGKTNVPNHQW